MDKSLKSVSLTKTCAICGLSKPLSAFLQFAGSVGASYGNICITCRKTNKDKTVSQPTDEGSSSSKIELKIDSKVKVKSDIDKRLLFEHTKELQHEERKEKNLLKQKRVSKIQGIAKKEKQHREGYLKKGSFLETKKSSGDSLNKQFFNRENAKNKTDYSKPILDTHISGKIKHHAPNSLAIQMWLGKAKGNNFLKNLQTMGLVNKNEKPLPKTSAKPQVDSKQPMVKPEGKTEKPATLSEKLLPQKTEKPLQVTPKQTQLPKNQAQKTEPLWKSQPPKINLPKKMEKNWSYSTKQPEAKPKIEKSSTPSSRKR